MTRPQRIIITIRHTLNARTKGLELYARKEATKLYGRGYRLVKRIDVRTIDEDEALSDYLLELK